VSAARGRGSSGPPEGGSGGAPEGASSGVLGAGSSSAACDACLRRALLVAQLAGRIAGLLERPSSRVGGLLALPEPEFVAAVAGASGEAVVEALDRRDLDADRAAFDEAGVGAVCRHAPAYPPLLHELSDPPPVLFAAGRPDTLQALGEEQAVAIVGTRRPSPYGIEVAHALGRGLGAAGLPVVSGLALGIDATAHRGCLDGRGLPVAVLACGPDVVYPRKHRGLHRQVLQHGLILSELPPGTQPYRWSFPARNRIMAGLARMTVVVEAADPSGSLITSDFARDLGRSVAAVPGHVTSRVARGTNGLLRDGAVPITSPQDVLDELFGAGLRRVPSALGQPAVEPADPLAQKVLQAVERQSSVAGIVAETRATTAEVRAALGRLEANGYVVRRDLGEWEAVLGAEG
jgi:DNA processing protein